MGVTMVSTKQNNQETATWEPNLSNRWFFKDSDNNGRWDGDAPPAPALPEPVCGATPSWLCSSGCPPCVDDGAMTPASQGPDHYKYNQVNRSIRFDNLANEVLP